MKDVEKIKSNKTLKELLEFGIINIDKPSGPTSFDISDFVRKTLKQLGVRKTSHFGTLDPKVTGVLPVALNRACKLTGFFLGEDKEYIGIMRIHEDRDLKEIEKVIKATIGSTGASGMKDMGRVMGLVSKELAGQADGKTISTLVKKNLM